MSGRGALALCLAVSLAACGTQPEPTLERDEPDTVVMEPGEAATKRLVPLPSGPVPVAIDRACFTDDSVELAGHVVDDGILAVLVRVDSGEPVELLRQHVTDKGSSWSASLALDRTTCTECSVEVVLRRVASSGAVLAAHFPFGVFRCEQ